MQDEANGKDFGKHNLSLWEGVYEFKSSGSSGFSANVQGGGSKANQRKGLLTDP